MTTTPSTTMIVLSSAPTTTYTVSVELMDPSTLEVLALCRFSRERRAENDETRDPKK